MYCPACKAEYRQGFTRCSDCGVDLVAQLPAHVPTNAIPPDTFANPTVLWTGTSREAQSALCTALEATNIKYKRQETDVGIIPGLAQPVYAVFVEQRDLNGAQFILERVAQHFETSDPADAGDGSANRQPPREADRDFGPVPDNIASDFNPENATEEIWSGDDPEMAETVRVCLRENGIGCMVEQLDGRHTVLVTPESQARAREIVDEIVRGTPMA